MNGDPRTEREKIDDFLEEERRQINNQSFKEVSARIINLEWKVRKLEDMHRNASQNMPVKNKR